MVEVLPQIFLGRFLAEPSRLLSLSHRTCLLNVPPESDSSCRGEVRQKTSGKHFGKTRLLNINKIPCTLLQTGRARIFLNKWHWLMRSSSQFQRPLLSCWIVQTGSKEALPIARLSESALDSCNCVWPKFEFLRIAQERSK